MSRLQWSLHTDSMSRHWINVPSITGGGTFLLRPGHFSSLTQGNHHCAKRGREDGTLSLQDDTPQWADPRRHGHCVCAIIFTFFLSAICWKKHFGTICFGRLHSGASLIINTPLNKTPIPYYCIICYYKRKS